MANVHVHIYFVLLTNPKPVSIFALVRVSIGNDSAVVGQMQIEIPYIHRHLRCIERKQQLIEQILVGFRKEVHSRLLGRLPIFAPIPASHRMGTISQQVVCLVGRFVFVFIFNWAKRKVCMVSFA